MLLVMLVATPACHSVPIGNDRSEGGADGAPASNCSTNADCVMFVDYCPATCGVCKAVRAPSPPTTCWPPPNVFCLPPCPDARVSCQAGRCVLS